MTEDYADMDFTIGTASTGGAIKIRFRYDEGRERIIEKIDFAIDTWFKSQSIANRLKAAAKGGE